MNDKYNSLILVYDKYEPINRQRIPMLDKVTFNQPKTISRSITAKTTPLTLDCLKKEFYNLRSISSKCERSRAYVMVGLSENKSPMSADDFASYIKCFYDELDFLGFDVCFVQIIFTPNYIEKNKQETLWSRRYKKVFEKFSFEKIKVVLEYKNKNIYCLTKNSYVNLWQTILEDYKEWCDYER